MNLKSGDTVLIAGNIILPYKVYANSDEAVANGERLGGPWVALSYFRRSSTCEGVDWCRADDPEAVKALKVARALR